MKKICITFITIFILCYGSLLFSQDISNFSSAFVDIGFGARPLGMGQAYSALATGADAIIWNPAGIIETKNFAATFSYAKQFDLIPYSFASAVYSVSPKLSFGGGTIISGDDLLNEISIITNVATRFKIYHYLANLGISAAFHSASYGGDSENGSVRGDALGYSFGVGIQLYLTDKIVAASHIQNLLNSISWNSSTLGKYNEGLPRRWIIGLGFKNFHQFNFDLDIHKSLYKEIDDKFYIGAERDLYHKAFLRAGAASSINQAEKLFYSFGGGLNQYFQQRFFFQLDFAYIFHPLENMFRISLTFVID